MVYAVLEITWACMLGRSTGNLLRLQVYVQVVICATLVQQVLTLVYYLLRDK